MSDNEQGGSQRKDGDLELHRLRLMRAGGGGWRITDLIKDLLS